MRRAALLGVLLAVAACAPDPTSGRPPAAADAAPSFESTVEAVDPAGLGASWRPGCPVGPEQLRLLTVSHWGYDGGPHRGRLVVHADHAAALVTVFRTLYDVRFQIERMETVDAYGGDDDASMAANNTSAFNCRRVGGTSTWSQHAYGTAVDVNPVQNPYVRGLSVAPEAGRPWLVRTGAVPGLVRAGDDVVRAFAAAGWSWGGDWSSARDYQHFSANGR